jgi:hypothetical protein
MKKVAIKLECESCSGTGLYRGFAEPPETAVVCLRCGGSGCEEISYTPFDKRKGKTGVKWVQRSKGSFILTGVGPVGERISYKDFQKGKMPT